MKEDGMDKETFEKGKAVRAQIMGSGHAQRTAKGRTEFNAEFQDFLMQYAWGEIWSRPALGIKLRSMLTISMLLGLGKMEELKLHFRATANTGVTRDEIKEILMHSAIYCGVPTAFGAFQVAAQIFDEMDKEAAQKP
jgi:4-carboxymuconolactone decarboxylase